MKPSHDEPRRRIRKINLRSILILCGILILVAVLYFPIRFVSLRAVRSSALTQAEAIAARGDVDLALRYLHRSMAMWPEDIPIMEATAKLEADTARDSDGLIRAANINDRLLRLDPDGPGRQETRRRLVRLWLRRGDTYRAATAIARQLIEKGARDAEAHRLLAKSLDGLILSGDAKAQPEAVREYEEALRLDPGDWESAERLALIDLTLRNDPAGAVETLDKLLRTRPDSVEVRQARYRYFLRAKQDDRARAELDAAVALEPQNVRLRLQVAADALRRGQSVEARAQLDAIPPEMQGDLRVRIHRGMLEATEQHLEEAIEQWRKGLASADGSHEDLTFQLAYALLQLDRLAEARPLIAQYRRLEGDDPQALGRYLQALYEQKSGHPAQAIDSLEKIRERVPPALQCELQVVLGRCQEALGDEGRAMVAYRRAIVANPRTVEPRRAIARLQIKRNPQAAVDEIDRALAQAPDDPGLLYEAGRIQLVRQSQLPPDQRQYRRLEEILAHGDKVAPKVYSLRSLRADYLVARGQPDQAVALLRRSAQVDDRTRIEPWLALASLVDQSGRHAEALRLLEEAAAPDAARDHVRLRVARAVILVRTGRGQEARQVLADGRDRVPAGEQAELARAIGDLAREMGDRDAARTAYLDWVRLAPTSPEPALSLIALGKLFNDEDSTRLGLEALRGIGDPREPYGLAAQAMQDLRPDPLKAGPPSAEKLDHAEKLLARLQADAPQLALGHHLRGMLMEYRENLPEAAASYRLALKDGEMTAALVGLVGVLTRLKQFDELDALRKRYEDRAAVSGNNALAVKFDQISASAALKLGDKDRAEAYATRIVEQVPDSLEARASLARIMDEMGKPKEAEATIKALVDRRPDDSAAWAALVTFQALRGQPGDAAKTVERIKSAYKGERVELLLGRCYWLLNEIPAAGRSYDEALAKNPGDPATLRATAEFDLANGRNGELEKVLRRSLQVEALSSWAARILALRLTSSNDPRAWDEAWSLVAPGAATSGETAEDRLIRATILARSPESRKRVEALPAMTALARDLPASHPVALEARIRLAQVMLEANRPAEAASWIAPIVDDPRQANPATLAISTEALARSGRPDQAQASLDRLVAGEPTSPRTTAARVWVFQARGKTAEAVAEIESGIAAAESAPEGEPVALAFFELARKLAPADAVERLAVRLATRWPDTAYFLAGIQGARGRVAEALASCRTALEAGSAREALRVGVSLAASRRDDPNLLKEVDSLAELARSKSPKDYEVLIFQATLRHIQDRYDEEIPLYREALALNPGHFPFLNNMAWTLSEGLGRYGEALTQVDEAIRRDGRTPQYLDTRGVILARLGRVAEALADLEASATAAPSPTTYFHLARTYLRAGKADAYRWARDQALKLKFDPKTLDATDRDGLEEVMTGKP